MANTQNKPGVPPQQDGASSDTEATANFKTPEEARAFFEVVKQRLLDVNQWQKWAGAATAHFQLTDAEGHNVTRTAQEGDHFKIDIPGPGPSTGDGYDWVRVEQIGEQKTDSNEEVTIQVRPATNPTNNRNDVAHFFTSEASSCFKITREETTVTASVHSRNEKPNTRAETLADVARNAAVATGAMAAFSKLQWKRLVEGLVKKEK